MSTVRLEDLVDQFNGHSFLNLSHVFNHDEDEDNDEYRHEDLQQQLEHQHLSSPSLHVSSKGIITISIDHNNTNTIAKPIGFSGRSSPEESANILSSLTFNWLNRFKPRWDKEYLKNSSKPSYLKAAIFTFAPYFMSSWLYYGVYVASQFVGPQLLGSIVKFIIESRDISNGTVVAPDSYDPNLGYYYALAIFGASMIGSFALYQSNLIALRVGANISTVMVCDIYRKALTLSNESRSKSTVGEIINMMSNDAMRVIELLKEVNNAVFTPVQVTVCIYFLYQTLGWPTFAGLGIMLLMIPINVVATNKFTTVRRAMITFSDTRLRLINDILGAIRTVKLYAWEEPFKERVEQCRAKEISKLYTFNFLRAGLMVIVNSMPTLVSVLVFSMYYMYYKRLESDKMFASLAYFNILRVPLGTLAFILSLVVQLNVSVKRITNFLLLPETPEVDQPSDPATPTGIYIQDAKFSWTDHVDTKSFTLDDLSITCTGPSLTMVIGSVGSGKSSLCQAMLGEMTLHSGSFTSLGRVSYVAQQAWLINASMRENIVFGAQFDSARYSSVLTACALDRDISLFPHGDLVQVGEKGITMSGGQRQRISMARALYHEADIYILDDPLSAVDSHVSKHLFNHVFLHFLREKTVILATNQLNYLPHASHIVVMKDGQIVERGTHETLSLAAGSVYFSMVESQCIEEEDSDDSINSVDTTNTSDCSDTPPELPQAKDAPKVQEEEKEKGAVSATVFMEYFRAWGGGIPFFISLLLLFVADVGSRAVVDWWMSRWSSDGEANMLKGLWIYMGIGLGSVAVTAARNFIFFGLSVRASAAIHRRLFSSIIRAPMSFFDKTPIGRIINRFTRDQDIIDANIPQSISQCTVYLLTVISSLTIVTIVTPVLLYALVPIIIIFYALQTMYRRTSRELQRLFSTTKSPIFEHFTESINGVATLRAFNQQSRYIQENYRRVDNNNKIFLTLQAANQWLGLRLDILGNIVILLAIIFISRARDTIDVAYVGLSISYALSITSTLNKATIQMTDMENKMNSVERVRHYIHCPVETTALFPAPRSWPSNGTIDITDLVMSYKPNLAPVLNGLTASIGAGEKIGIVGRTGAGKSSIVAALFRLVESSHGSIVIDGVDTSMIDLAHLRRNLSIIPQDPVLFSGTLRSNLDPFNETSDTDLWQVLRDIQLTSTVSQLDGGLDSVVTDNGSNWSMGQKQLISLGRALLRRPKILILDEATASVDPQTDALIQRTITNNFSKATILTIAHRLNTIMHSDRIMVLDAGRITEFDTPKNLLTNPGGLFTWLVDETGVQNSSLLRRMVDQKWMFPPMPTCLRSSATLSTHINQL
eukprot:gene4376-5119_t